MHNKPYFQTIQIDRGAWFNIAIKMNDEKSVSYCVNFIYTRSLSET